MIECNLIIIHIKYYQNHSKDCSASEIQNSRSWKYSPHSNISVYKLSVSGYQSNGKETNLLQYHLVVSYSAIVSLKTFYMIATNMYQFSWWLATSVKEFIYHIHIPTSVFTYIDYHTTDWNKTDTYISTITTII